MKKIPLTKGKFAIVDDGDFEYLNSFNWCIQGEYAARWKSVKAGEAGGTQSFCMHRVIMGLGDKDGCMEVDHVNGDKLDNRKVNLRICTHSQNSKNRKSLCNQFGYKGITKYSSGKYQAMIWDGKNNLHLGMFVEKEDAAKAYDNAALEIHGIYARLNFPRK